MVSQFNRHIWRYGWPGRTGKGLAAIAVTFALSQPVFAQTKTIAALGDSLTQGYGLIQQEGFVDQLQAWLRARGHDVIIANSGVSGDTTAGGLSRVDWTLGPKIDAMIVALGGNDVLRGIAPQVARANLDGILQAAHAKDVPVLLIGISAPGNYGPDYKSDFEAIYPDLSAQYDTLLHPNFLSALIRREELADLMQQDGIHPNAQGVALVVEDIGPKVEALLERLEN